MLKKERYQFLVQKAIYAVNSIVDSIGFACRRLCRLDAVLLSNGATGLCRKLQSLGERTPILVNGTGCSNRSVLLVKVKWALAQIRGPDGLGGRFQIGLGCFRARDHGRLSPLSVVSG